MENIALFPIPGSVSFPGTVVPLHVFEPRYRKMVDYCIDHNMQLGIAHTQRVIHKAVSKKALPEALNSNASTYKACDIFSAGTCEVKDTLEDGRLLIRVSMHNRYKRVERIQSLPFEIYRCEIVPDEGISLEGQDTIRLLKEKIITRLKALCSESAEMMKLLQSPKICAMTPVDFSFKIFQLIRLEVDDQQSALELLSPLARLDFMLKQLNRI